MNASVNTGTRQRKAPLRGARLRSRAEQRRANTAVSRAHGDRIMQARSSGCRAVVRAECTAVRPLARGQQLPRQQQRQEPAGETDEQPRVRAASRLVSAQNDCGHQANFSVLRVFAAKIFFACGALSGASRRGLWRAAKNRLPWPSPSSPSVRQWELEPRALPQESAPRVAFAARAQHPVRERRVVRGAAGGP